MLRTKVLLATLVAVCALSVTVAVAAPVSMDPPVANSGNLVRTTLQPDLTLKSTFSPELSPATTTAAANHHGYCRCSCGYPCETSADCGGASCDPFISCCMRGEPGPSTQIDFGKSTRAGEEPAVNIQCK
jgi:hypothetical protein